jgi:hypothetical protein
MSVGATLGYPDWVRPFAAARDLLYLDINRTIAATVASAAIAAGNLHSVGIKLLPTTNHTVVRLKWFFDQTLVSLVTTDAIDVRQDGVFDQTVTVKGPYLSVEVEPHVAPSSTYSLLVYGAPASSVTHLTPTDPVLLSYDGANIAAGATRTDDYPRVFAGPAILHASTIDSPNWTFRLKTLESNGTVKTLLRLSQTVTPGPVLVHLPACNIRAEMVNNDAVARLFVVGLVAKPLYP